MRSVGVSWRVREINHICNKIRTFGAAGSPVISVPGLGFLLYTSSTKNTHHMPSHKVCMKVLLPRRKALHASKKLPQLMRILSRSPGLNHLITSPLGPTEHAIHKNTERTRRNRKILYQAEAYLFGGTILTYNMISLVAAKRVSTSRRHSGDLPCAPPKNDMSQYLSVRFRDGAQ